MSAAECSLTLKALKRVENENSPTNYSFSTVYSRAQRELKCNSHRHFCLIFLNIAFLTNSSTLISKIIVAKLNSCVKMVF